MNQSRIAKLINENDDMKHALQVVLEQTDSQGSIGWQDVNTDLSSGQWGRLIETGILTDSDDGKFELSDPEQLRTVLEEGNTSNSTETSAPTKSESDDVEGTTWSIYDKLAAVASIGLFAGYSISSIRNVVGQTVDIVFGPLDAALPFYLVILIAAMITGLYSTLLQANLMDMEKMGAYQEQMKDIQRRQKDAKERGDEEAQQRIREEQMEAMGDQMGMFKEQFRPMVWTMFITIPVFLWLYWMIGPGAGASRLDASEPLIVLPIFGGPLEWTHKVVGPMQVWIVWYFICSMAFTQLIRKAFNIQTTPT
jgi:uncharacterized membrane protein (DUF106 family)